MAGTASLAGYRFGMAAFIATATFVVVQLAQVVGLLRFPADEILIYGTSLCIVVPFVLEMVALHHVTSPDRQFWTHAAVVFTVIYAVFVTANYVVQLATVIPARLSGTADDLRLLEQTPHSMFWDFDAIGYIAMGIAMLLAIPALDDAGVGRGARRALLANALVTPLIAIVYFYPTFSVGLLMLGLPWAITAPLAMLMVARWLRHRALHPAGA